MHRDSGGNLPPNAITYSGPRDPRIVTLGSCLNRLEISKARVRIRWATCTMEPKRNGSTFNLSGANHSRGETYGTGTVL
jgi:hypothetical protein